MKPTTLAIAAFLLWPYVPAQPIPAPAPIAPLRHPADCRELIGVKLRELGSYHFTNIRLVVALEEAARSEEQETREEISTAIRLAIPGTTARRIAATHGFAAVNYAQTSLLCEGSYSG